MTYFPGFLGLASKFLGEGACFDNVPTTRNFGFEVYESNNIDGVFLRERR